MRSILVVVVLCLQMASVLTQSFNTCNNGCTCTGEDEGAGAMTKTEGLATAVGAMVPLVVGGAGLAIYKAVKSAGSLASEAAKGAVNSMPSPRLSHKRGSWDQSVKSSPTTPYHGTRRGSTPLSLLSEDDISLGDPSLSPRPDLHGFRRGRDVTNRWL
ncbi:uncharacterized protein LOC143281511 [Babylonia areolata]|uniref:uncharacterized protein LOC143281511 n=1 Tax=Babylonia areolata TaxID=304850 RepID=UPI003FD539E7